MSQNVNDYQINLREIRLRAYRAVTQDGLLELLTGIGFAAATIFVALDTFFDVPLFYLIGIPVVLLPMMLTPLRRRYTHARIGYVELVSEENKRLLWGILAAAAGLGVLMLVVVILSLVQQQAALPFVAMYENLAAILGLLFGAAFLYMAVSYAITRYYVFGLLSIAGGFVAQIVNTESLTPTADPVAKWMIYFALMTVILLPSGALRFASFLRNNPVLEEEGGDA